ncbi:MAG: type II secretion system F family protein [Gemmatimonadaceae bacterium]|nr:type II secretion system F family protein [Gemmatimonadaceae bacterium]
MGVSSSSFVPDRYGVVAPDPDVLYVKPAALLALMRPLTRMVGASITPARAFEGLGDSSVDPNVRALCYGLARRIERGHSEAAAMSEYPRIFTPSMVAEIQQGAIAGDIASAFRNVADVLERETKIRHKISGVLLQPIITLAMLVVVMLIQLGFTMPKMKPVYAMVDPSDLPAVTRLEMAGSDLMLQHPIWFLGTLTAIIAGLTYWLRSPGGQQSILRAATRVWPVRGLVLQQIRARFLRDLARLQVLQSGRRMIDLVCEGIPIDELRERLERIGDRLEQGRSLGAALEETEFFSANALMYITGGEQSGDLPSMLRAAADEETVLADLQLDRLIAMLPNLLLILTTVVVGLTLWGQYGGLLGLQNSMAKKARGEAALPMRLHVPLSAPDTPLTLPGRPGLRVVFATVAPERVA